MGTRNLTMVISNGKTKVAQYGQWDGYPEGQGKTILEFLREANLKTFKSKVDKLNWLTDEQIDELDKDGKAYENHPYLSRDCGGQILSAITYGKMTINEGMGKRKAVKVNVVGLVDSSDFAGDSLFCEWAYVIDLDKETFEVYKGFNTSPVPKGERFTDLPQEKDNDKYYPVRHLKTYSLNKLPSIKSFINIGKEKEEA